MLVVIQCITSKNHSWTEVLRYPSFWWKEVQFVGRLHCQHLHHDFGNGCVWKSVECSPDSLFDNSVVPFCFWNMFLCTCIIHFNVQIIFDIIHNRSEFIITVNHCNSESCFVVLSKYSVQCTPVIFDSPCW